MKRRGIQSLAALAAALFAGSAAADAPLKVDGPDRIAFDAAIAQALARNPTVTVAQAEIRRAEGVVQETRAAALPSLWGVAAYTRLDADRVSGGTVIAAQSQLSASATLAVPLLATRSWAQWAHAKENVAVARLSVAEVQRQLAISVAHVYLSLIAQHRVIEVEERARAAAASHLDYAHARFAGGYGNRLDEVRAAQELATDGAQLEAALSQLARLQESLGVLLGSDRAWDVVDDELRLPAIPDRKDAMESARSSRSDVSLSLLRHAAAHHLVRDGWTDYMPLLTGTFQPFFQNPPTLTLPETGWQAQLALTVPLYDGGMRYGQQRERKALELEARATLDGTLRQADSDVRASFEEVAHARAAAGNAREAARLAVEALALTNLSYRAGATTNIEVIDAERQSRDAQTAAVIAEDAERQAVIDVLVASGRFPQR